MNNFIKGHNKYSFIILLITLLSGCMSYSTKMFPIEKEQTEDIKSIKIVSDLDPVTTDLIYQIVLEMGEYTVVERNPQATLYFSKSHLETHVWSKWNLLYYATIIGWYYGNYSRLCSQIYFHEYYITVKAVSAKNKVQAVFDSTIGRHDCSPTGFINKDQLSKMIMLTLKRLKTG